MVTGSCSDACNIQVWSTWICLFDSLVCVTCTGLWQDIARSKREWIHTYLDHLSSTSEVGLVEIWIGQECHSRWQGDVVLPRPISHMLSGEVPIHDKRPDEMIPWGEFVRERIEEINHINILGIFYLPVIRKIYPRLRTCGAEDGHGSILRCLLLRLIPKPSLHPILQVSPLTGCPQ